MPELAVVRLLYENIRPEIGEDMIRKIMSSFPPNVFSGFGIEDFELTPDLIVEKPTDRTMNKYPYDVEPGVDLKKLETRLKCHESVALAVSPIPGMVKRPLISWGCGAESITSNARKFYKNGKLGMYGLEGYGHDGVAFAYQNEETELGLYVHELGHALGVWHHRKPGCAMTLSQPCPATFCDRHYQILGRKTNQ